MLVSYRIGRSKKIINEWGEEEAKSLNLHFSMV